MSCRRRATICGGASVTCGSLLGLIGFEAVPHPGLRDEVAGPCRFGLELAAHLGHEDAQVVRLRAVLRAPHLLEQLALADQLAAAANEHLDKVPLRGRQTNLLAIARY